MADPRKNQILVVLVILGYLSSPAFCFSQDLQHYTQEISRRSFAMMDGMFDNDGLLMKFGYPIFIICTFISTLNSLIALIATYIPGLAGLISFGGPLSMLAGFPSQDLVTARNGTEREQRLLDYVDDQVKSSVAAGQNEFENELKKKKK